MQMNMVKPAAALAGMAAAGSATAATTLDVNYTPSATGTPVAIGVPEAQAQYSFSNGAVITDSIKLVGNGGATLGELDSARYPTAGEATSTTVKTYDPGFPFGVPGGSSTPIPPSSLDFVGLRFMIGTTDYFGYATLTDEGSVIDTITYDVVGAPATPVPEPATWATMIAGLGLAGAAMRRRRRTVQPANA